MGLFGQVNEAAMAALEERLEFRDKGTSSLSSSSLIEMPHFERALSKIKPSVSEQVWANAKMTS
jgi:ribosome biogenesis ATPase